MRHTHRCHNIRKRCPCGWRKWSKCSHPWHFFYKFRGREYRFQLNEAAGKPPEYVMGKTEAEGYRDNFRSQIRSGKFAGQLVEQTVAGPMTFGRLADIYLEQHVRIPTRREGGRVMMELMVRRLRNIEIPAGPFGKVKFEERPLTEITKADVEELRKASRVHKPRAKGGEVGTNRLLSRLRHLFSWAIAEGYTESTPFKRHGVTVVKLNSSAEAPRSRRLEAGEEEKLLANATPDLKAIIVAALETGCRLGELLSLQWGQVKREENIILLPAGKTKTNEARAVPLTSRLRAVLETRKHDPSGNEFGAGSYVFGDEIGEKRESIREDWDECRRMAGIVGLHFHDLRREFASRLLETPGVSLHDVSDWVGHTNVVTTSRYLATSGIRRQAVLERFEAARSVHVTS